MLEKWLYNIIFPPGLFVYRIYSLFDEKARSAFKTRQGQIKTLESQLKNLGSGKRVLFHISSVGEYLQVRPVLRLIRENFPGVRLCLTFFSPSAERLLARGVEAELACYLPFDRKNEMRRFLELVKPDLVVFSCYDLWPNFIWLCKERKIPLVLINATLAENSHKLRRGVRWWFSTLYQELDLILSASEDDSKAIASLGISEKQIIPTGNARFDETIRRIRTISPEDELLKLLRPYFKGQCLVCGSTWPDDEEVIVSALDRLWNEGWDLKVIIAPHEPGARKVEQLRKNFLAIGVKPVLLWELESNREGIPKESKILIINTVGHLYKLYQLGSIAFVGGSFKKEVHNVMEPAGFGLPVLFGPLINNSWEARELVKRGAGFVAKNSEELYEHLRIFLKDEERRLTAGKEAYRLVMEHQGAGEKILKLLTERFPDVFKKGEQS